MAILNWISAPYLDSLSHFFRTRALQMKSYACLALVAIPLDQAKLWTELRFSKITPNQIAHSKGQLRIEVDGSASPLLHAFPSPLRVRELRISGLFHSLPTFPKTIRQGQAGADDFALRLGLVVEGKKKMNSIEKLMAPNWLLEAAAIFGVDKGIAKVIFLNAYQDEHLKDVSRFHPLSDIMHESFVWKLTAPGVFHWEYKLPVAVDAMGLWVSCDGDDTKSKFQVEIHKIDLEI